MSIKIYNFANTNLPRPLGTETIRINMKQEIRRNKASGYAKSIEGGVLKTITKSKI